MTDIVKRLRAAEFRHMPYLCNEAADRIEELEKALTLAQTCLDEATNSDQNRWSICKATIRATLEERK